MAKQLIWNHPSVLWKLFGVQKFTTWINYENAINPTLQAVASLRNMSKIHEIV